MPRVLVLTAGMLSWLLPVGFLAWAARLVFLEGYFYRIPADFLGDFTRTISLGAPTWFNGQGIFYGPVFVLEYRYLFAPGIMSKMDFARLNFLLFGVAFACAWLGLFGRTRVRLGIWVLAAWLAHHATVDAFATTAHLEILELMLLCAALLLAVHDRALGAGGLLGLAAATKTLPGLFLPYLAIMRQWRMLLGASVLAGVPFLVVCWLQQVGPLEGLMALVYQGGNLTKLEFTENEYTLRAEVARTLAGDTGVLTDDQARLAIAFQWGAALLLLALAAWVLVRIRVGPRSIGLVFGLIAAVMLVASPSAHIRYYIFLLPAWTAMLVELLRRPLSALTVGLWLALAGSYTFTGFDQPFFLSQRLLGIGLVVPQHWLAWHLPTLGLLTSILALVVLLKSLPAESARGHAPVAEPRSPALPALSGARGLPPA